MNTIRIKPLSVNEAFNGRRTRSKKYNSWILEMSYLLPKLVIPKGRLKVSVEFGFSSKGSDLDNGMKSLQDSLSKQYGFNDNQIYELNLKKEIVPKGKEYIKFKIDEP